VVGLQPHPQRRAQAPAGQADLDPAGAAVPVVLGRPAHLVLAGAPPFVVPASWPLSSAATQLRTGRPRSGGTTTRPRPAAVPPGPDRPVAAPLGLGAWLRRPR